MEKEFPSFFVQPVTLGGVAGFAYVRARRLWLYQLFVALLAAGAMTAFFELAWVPTIRRAIAALPSAGIIQHGTLTGAPADWPGPVSSRFLSFHLNPNDSVGVGEGADVQVEFGRSELRVRSLFGMLAFPYPDGYVIALNRTEVEAWWGAWHPPVVTALGVGTLVGLLVVWNLLGLVYTWPVRLIAFYADRRISWAGAWRVASACLLPGALWFTLAIAAYTWQRLNLVQFLFAAALHVLIPWGYVLAAPFSLRRETSTGLAVGKKNPFGGSTVRTTNPFADRSGKP